MTQEQLKWRRIIETDKKSNFAAQCEVSRFLDDMFYIGYMDIVDLLIKDTDVTKLSNPLLISILSSTCHAKMYLFNRNDFVKRVRQHFVDQKLDDIEGLMKGLE